MPTTWLSVSHLQQRSQADCLPVCAQMVLAYLNRPQPYERMVVLLGTRWFGTPFRHLKRLEQFGLSVKIGELSLAEIESYLEAGSHAPQLIPRIEFELAQLRYDNLCAVITA